MIDHPHQLFLQACNIYCFRLHILPKLHDTTHNLPYDKEEKKNKTERTPAPIETVHLKQKNKKEKEDDDDKIWKRKRSTIFLRQ